MKIHFIGALEGDQAYYQVIIDTIKSLGYRVITNHAAVRSVKHVYQEQEDETQLYVQKMQAWIRESDIVVVEVTYPGFGSGLEIGIALQNNKQVIAIFQPNATVLPTLSSRESNWSVFKYSHIVKRH